MESTNVPKVPDEYKQWVVIYLKNVGSGNVKLKNLDVSWGKYRRIVDDKDTEVSKDVFEGRVIAPDEQIRLNACGRASSPSGTTGDFDLCDADDSDKVIRHFYWDCPWGSSTNHWTVSNSNSKWMVEHYGANLEGGALGTITVDLMKKGKKDL